MTSALPGSSSTVISLSPLHPVVELRRRQHLHVAPILPRLREFQEDVGIHQVAQHFVVQRFAPDLLLHRRRGLLQFAPEAAARRDARAAASRLSE